jgi:hypothetical protein
MVYLPPIVGEMIVALSDSVKELRRNVTNVRSEIRGDHEYIQFDLNGKHYDLPMRGECADYLVGWGEESDRRIAIKVLLSQSETEIKL